MEPFATAWAKALTKVLAINGSARMEKGNTAMVLTPFLDGMREAGASVELFYAKLVKAKPCTGEFYCWYEKPGQCYIHDNMQSLYPKLRRAEIVVLATPVYIPLPGEMQNLINRLCPLMEPILKKQNGRTRARFHTGVKISKIVLVSTCGWWEKGNFQTVLRIAKEFAKDASIEFAGAILRPHAFLMTEYKEEARNILEAARQAGYQLVKEGKMSKNLLDVIGQPLISEEELRHRYNNSYERVRGKEKD
jgi:multimeric flavodoxin WrbA